jgi:hypothetical protein
MSMHTHKCPKCGNVWVHDCDGEHTSEEFKAAHTCESCLSEVYDRYYGGSGEEQYRRGKIKECGKSGNATLAGATVARTSPRVEIFEIHFVCRPGQSESDAIGDAIESLLAQVFSEET